MKKMSDYRAHAKECRALARKAVTEAERKQLMDMAETWESLAQQREDFVKNHPELSRQTSDAGGPEKGDDNK